MAGVQSNLPGVPAAELKMWRCKYEFAKSEGDPLRPAMAVVNAPSRDAAKVRLAAILEGKIFYLRVESIAEA